MWHSKKQAVAPAVTVHQYIHNTGSSQGRQQSTDSRLLPSEHFWDGMLMLASIASRKATPENPLESSPTSYTDKASEERKGMMMHTRVTKRPTTNVAISNTTTQNHQTTYAPWACNQPSNSQRFRCRIPRDMNRIKSKAQAITFTRKQPQDIPVSHPSPRQRTLGAGW